MERWLASLEKRHFAELTFPEVTRALRALSSVYVQRRGRLAQGAALEGAGKRAAFALFYAPLHFLLIDHIVRQLPGALNEKSRAHLVDLGCGTGAASAAWAVATGINRVLGIDRAQWVLAEARETYREFGLSARTKQADAARVPLPAGPAVFLAAFTMNELPQAARETLMNRLVQRASRQGDAALIVEPIARRSTPWWAAGQRTFEAAGGRADDWRFPAELPPLVAKLDRAAGLNHRELTARTLWLPSRAGGRSASS